MDTLAQLAVRVTVLFTMTCLVWSAPLLADEPNGIAPLRVDAAGASVTVGAQSRPLMQPSDVERFLEELERTPPSWADLRDQPGEELGERLFAYNRRCDDQRADHPLLAQRITFVWDGFLRRYDEERHGYVVALGPTIIDTSWGAVRFKPATLPRDLIARPPRDLADKLRRKLNEGIDVPVTVRFTGTLIDNESLMYAFSHEHEDVGMILPFVELESVDYILNPSVASRP